MWVLCNKGSNEAELSTCYHGVINITVDDNAILAL
jgi:hypothetical protein